MIDPQKFGDFLAAVRREQNMTQAELAAQIHVTDKAVSRWERGAGFPDINTLEPLAEALGLSVVELMQAERGSTGDEAASRAISDTVSLAQQARSLERSNSLVGLLCIGMALLSLAVLGLSALPEILVFYCALAALMIASAYLKQNTDKETARICKGVIVIALGVGAGAIVLLLPEIVLERYGALFGLLCTGFLFFDLAREALNALQNRREPARGKLAILIVMNLAALLVVGGSIRMQVTHIKDAAVIERETVVRQYADALVTGEFDLDQSDLTGRVLTYAAPTGQYPMEFYAAYQFYNGTGEEITYGYRLLLDRTLAISVKEQGVELGESILGEVSAEQEAT